MSKAKVITEANEGVITTKGIVLVDFHASWCGPCKLLSPIVDKVAEQYEGKATVAKADADDVPGLFAHYQVRSMPTLIFFRDGEIVDRMVGMKSRKIIQDKLEELLNE